MSMRRYRDSLIAMCAGVTAVTGSPLSPEAASALKALLTYAATYYRLSVRLRVGPQTESETEGLVEKLDRAGIRMRACAGEALGDPHVELHVTVDGDLRLWATVSRTSPRQSARPTSFHFTEDALPAVTKIRTRRSDHHDEPSSIGLLGGATRRTRTLAKATPLLTGPDAARGGRHGED